MMSAQSEMVINEPLQATLDNWIESTTGQIFSLKEKYRPYWTLSCRTKAHTWLRGAILRMLCRLGQPQSLSTTAVMSADDSAQACRGARLRILDHESVTTVPYRLNGRRPCQTSTAASARSRMGLKSTSRPQRCETIPISMSRYQCLSKEVWCSFLTRQWLDERTFRPLLIYLGYCTLKSLFENTRQHPHIYSNDSTV